MRTLKLVALAIVLALAGTLLLATAAHAAGAGQDTPLR